MNEIEALVPWVTDRQIAFWCSKGYIRPQGGAGPGGYEAAGRPARAFSYEEKRVLKVMARLVRGGFQAAVAAKVARRAVEVAGPSGAVRIRIDPGIIVDISEI